MLHKQAKIATNSLKIAPQRLFAAVSRAIAEHDIHEVSKAIASTPLLFLHRDITGNTLLHYAVMNGDIDTVELIFNHIVELNKLKMITGEQNGTSDTLLHLAAEFNSEDVVRFLIENLGSQIKVMLKLTNKRGKIPLQLIAENPHETMRKRIQDLLLPMTLDCDFKRITQKISEAAIVKQYAHSDKGSSLESNLKSACIAANLARQCVSYSINGMQANFYNHKRKCILTEKVKLMRSELSTVIPSLVDVKPDELKAMVPIIKKHKIANCAELTDLTIYYLLKDPVLRLKPIEFIGFLKKDSAVDHCFVVIDRQKASKISNPETWGDNAVICDTLSGEVFPAKEFYKKTMVFFHYSTEQTYYNVLAYPNREFHRLFSFFSNNPEKAVDSSYDALCMKKF